MLSTINGCKSRCKSQVGRGFVIEDSDASEINATGFPPPPTALQEKEKEL